MTASAAGLTLDASRQRLSPAIQTALLSLAEQADVAAQRDAMFRGDAINTTEKRPVLHVALRGQQGPWGEAISADVARELDRVCTFADGVRSGAITGHSDEPFTDIVNIGIGGSDLGPRMAADALAHLTGAGPRVHYVSNPDAWALYSVLHKLDAARTLVVVSSKTFTTQETLTNAASCQRWLTDNGVPAERLASHLVAITASPSAVGPARLRRRQHLPLLGLGGRPLFPVVGPGPAARHRHRWRGLPRIPGRWAGHGRALLHRTTGQQPARADGALGHLEPQFLAVPHPPHRALRFAGWCASRPSCSKWTWSPTANAPTKTAHPSRWTPAPSSGVAWASTASTPTSSCCTRANTRCRLTSSAWNPKTRPCPWPQTHHHVVNLNLRAQAQAMAEGRSVEATRALLEKDGNVNADELDAMAAQRSFEGNLPSNILWIDKLDPSRLGALIALYEHKVFTQAAIWGINAYDQWGVELGKTMAKAMESKP